MHVGDSTSIGLMSKDYLPKKKDRVDAQYRKVGAEDADTDISGARSIVERWKDQPNAQDAVKAKLDKGYDGCWVLAMGTNEVANQSAGGNTPLSKRIDLLMEPIGNHPVLWLTIKTLRSSGPVQQRGEREVDQGARRRLRAATPTCGFTTGPVRSRTPGTSTTASTSPPRATRSAASGRRGRWPLAFPKDAAPPPGCLMVPS